MIVRLTALTSRARAGVALVAGCFLISLVFSSEPVLAAPVLIPETSQKATAPDDGRYQVALSFLERLFGGGKKKKPTSKSKKRTGGTAGTKRKVPAKPFVATVPKDPDATVIAVFGDELGQDIAYGLKDAFAKIPDVKIDIHTVGRTGLLHRSARNPLNDLQTLVEKKPFSFAVVMTGLNDRIKSPVKKDEDGIEIEPSHDFRSDAWAEAYIERIDALRNSFALQEKPLYWVGMPPVSNKKLSDDLLYLNDRVRSRISGRTERYIDVWDAFLNEEGEFSFRGPDLSGQEKRLRQKNGIRFNRAGRRKLAHFVEKLVIRILSQSVDEAALPDFLSPADEAALKEGRGASRDIFVVRKPSVDSAKLIDPSTFRTDQGVDPTVPDTASVLDASSRDLRVDAFGWNAAQ